MIADPNGAPDAVILVDDAGAVTLFIGDEPEPRAEATTNTVVIRILMDHAASLGQALTVATHYPSGYRTLHTVEPDGAITTVPGTSSGGSVPDDKPDAAAVTRAPGAAPVGAGAASAGIGSAPGGADHDSSPPAHTVLGAWRMARPSTVLGITVLLAAPLALISSAGPLSADLNDHLGEQSIASDANTAELEISRPDSTASPTPESTPPRTTSAPTPSQPGTTSGPGPSPDGSPSQSPTGTPGQTPGGAPGDSTGPDDDTSGDAPLTQGQEPEPETEPEPEPPSRPNGMTVADRSGTSLTVSWSSATAELGVTGYAVYLDGSRIDTVSQTRATVGGLDSGVSYTVAVAATDNGGNIGPLAAVTATTTDVESPQSPVALAVADRTGTSLTTSWGAASDNVGVTDYAVYLDGQRVRTVSATSATVDGLNPATSYEISVAALDAAGNISGRTSVNGKTKDTVAPAKPRNLSGGPGGSAVRLDWTSSSDNVGVTGYAIYVDGERVRTTTDTTVIIRELQGGVTYTFAVAAYDAAGNLSTRARVDVSTIAGA